MDLVAGAVGSIIRKLGELLQAEYKLQKGLPQQIESLKHELESAHTALLKVGEVRPEQLDPQVRLWAREVREASYDMEDILDTFLVDVVEVADAPAEKKDSLRRRLKNMMDKLFKKSKARHTLAAKKPPHMYMCLPALSGPLDFDGGPNGVVPWVVLAARVVLESRLVVVLSIPTRIMHDRSASFSPLLRRRRCPPPSDPLCAPLCFAVVLSLQIHCSTALRFILEFFRDGRLSIRVDPAGMPPDLEARNPVFEDISARPTESKDSSFVDDLCGFSTIDKEAKVAPVFDVDLFEGSGSSGLESSVNGNPQDIVIHPKPMLGSVLSSLGTQQPPNVCCFPLGSSSFQATVELIVSCAKNSEIEGFVLRKINGASCATPELAEASALNNALSLLSKQCKIVVFDFSSRLVEQICCCALWDDVSSAR